jgi:hypothetical protein
MAKPSIDKIAFRNALITNLKTSQDFAIAEQFFKNTYFDIDIIHANNKKSYGEITITFYIENALIRDLLNSDIYSVAFHQICIDSLPDNFRIYDAVKKRNEMQSVFEMKIIYANQAYQPSTILGNIPTFSPSIFTDAEILESANRMGTVYAKVYYLENFLRKFIQQQDTQQQYSDIFDEQIWMEELFGKLKKSFSIFEHEEFKKLIRLCSSIKKRVIQLDIIRNNDIDEFNSLFDKIITSNTKAKK